MEDVKKKPKKCPLTPPFYGNSHKIHTKKMGLPILEKGLGFTTCNTQKRVKPETIYNDNLPNK